MISMQFQASSTISSASEAFRSLLALGAATVGALSFEISRFFCIHCTRFWSLHILSGQGQTMDWKNSFQWRMVEIWWLSCLFSYVQLNHRLLFLFAFAAAAARSIPLFSLVRSVNLASVYPQSPGTGVLEMVWIRIEVWPGFDFWNVLLLQTAARCFPKLDEKLLEGWDLQIKKQRMTREVLSIEQNINCRMDKITKLESIDP